ncbi:MAG: fused response regulator/phosphatase [Spirochaetales bacterium]|nr:fused response regulator/phosphatase [Spirochaetales bacterium]
MRKHKVLVVDDDNKVLNALRREINSFSISENLDLLFFNSPENALNYINCNDNISLVITDMKMPVMNGDELLLNMRKKTPDSSAILLSAYTDIDAITSSIGAGLVSFVQKPWNSSHLMNEINRGVEMCSMKRIMKQYIRDISNDLNAYGSFQKSLVRNGIPRHEKIEFDVYTETLPHQSSSSDYYTAIKIDNNRFLYFLADGNGPGFKSSSKILILRTILKEYIDGCDDIRNLTPKVLLEHLNSKLHSHLEQSTGETVQCCALLVDLEFNNITAAAGGRIIPMLIRSASTYAIEATGPSLGNTSDQSYEEVMYSLHSGDRIVMYTDGLTTLEKQFGPFHRLMRKYSMNESFIDDLLVDIRDFLKDRVLIDDMTIMTFRIKE